MNTRKPKFQLTVSIIKEGNRYIAYSPALDLSTSGKNYEEAKKRFNEMVNIFFEEVIKAGTLKEVLENLGWKRIKSAWNPPVVIGQELQTVCLNLK